MFTSGARSRPAPARLPLREEPVMAVSHSVVPYEPTETSPEVTTAAGFLAGYAGRTRRQRIAMDAP